MVLVLGSISIVSRLIGVAGDASAPTAIGALWALLEMEAGPAVVVPAAPGPVSTVVLLCAAMFLMTGATPVYASSALDLAPQDCIYVGDDLRDMLAAHAAGMHSVAAAWGYGDALESWNADRIIERPTDLIPVL